jgi:hypothetical protein
VKDTLKFASALIVAVFVAAVLSRQTPNGGGANTSNQLLG